MAIDKASQDSSKPTSSEDYQGITIQLNIKEVPVSSEGTTIDKASQDGGRATNKASQDGQGPAEVMPSPVVDENCRTLFVAAQKGDWKTVEKILKDDREAMHAEVMTGEDGRFTVLDVAIRSSQYKLVKNLIKRSPRECKDLEAQLPHAASAGGKNMVKEILKNVRAPPESVQDALRIATTHAPKQKEAIWCLAKRTESAPSREIMLQLIRAGHPDIALYLAPRYQASASLDENIGLLELLAMTKSNFRSGVRLTFWEKFIDKFIGIPLCLVDTSFDNPTETKTTRGGAPASKWFKISLLNYATKPALLNKRIGLRHKCSLEFANLVLSGMKDHMKTHKILECLSKIVLDAASCGISEIVKLCFEHFPELTWNKKFTEHLMIKVVKGRNVELFRLVNSPSTIPLVTDETRKKLMETVVEWSPSCQSTDVCGAPFLMQRELQWFKVLEATSNTSSHLKIEKWIPKSIDPTSKSQNWDDFLENRKQLLEEAWKWMKDTSSYCILVSTLIITVTFAAAFTVPGGNNDDIQATGAANFTLPGGNDAGAANFTVTGGNKNETGHPIFLKEASFLVFALGDALALFSSVTATLMFLAILTSRYMAEDFLYSLPTKMILGLSFLFLSLAFMLVSFGSAFTIVLSGHFTQIYIPVTLLGAIPVILFAILHLSLFFEMMVSTYWPRLYRPLKLWE